MNDLKNTSSSGLPQHSVLVLDDDPLVRWSLGNALEKAGIRVTTTESGEEGLKLVKSMCFDLIITEMELPQINGFEVASSGRLRFQGIPVIMLTASADEASRLKAAEMGINYFIDKPFDLAEIVRLVKTLIPGVS